MLAESSSAARVLGVVAAGYGFLGVAISAFAAHAARSRMDAQHLAWLETGARYQLLHGLAILIVLLLPHAAGGSARSAAVCFVAGVAVFSGTLYAMALGGPRILGAITPVGGLLLLAGWLLAGIAAYRSL